MKRTSMTCVTAGALTLAALVNLTACTAAQRGAGIGAAGGALLGGIVGHQSGHRTEGALVGAAAGGLLGALIGDGIDEHRDRRRARETQATREDLWQRIDQLEEENGQLRQGLHGPTHDPYGYR